MYFVFIENFSKLYSIALVWKTAHFFAFALMQKQIFFHFLKLNSDLRTGVII